MKEIELVGGQDITSAIKRLVVHAPSFCVFNGIRIECEPGMTVEDVQANWERDIQRRQDEYAQSEEGRRHERERVERIRRANETLAQTVRALDTLPFDDLSAVLAWIASFEDETDLLGVDKEELLAVMPKRFAAHGLLPNMNTGAAYDGEDFEDSAKYLIGQALSFLTEPPYAVHGVWRSFYKEWLAKFERPSLKSTVR
jgi:hypothetical protein